MSEIQFKLQITASNQNIIIVCANRLLFASTLYYIRLFTFQKMKTQSQFSKLVDTVWTCIFSNRLHKMRSLIKGSREGRELLGVQRSTRVLILV